MPEQDTVRPRSMARPNDARGDLFDLLPAERCERSRRGNGSVVSHPQIDSREDGDD